MKKYSFKAAMLLTAAAMLTLSSCNTEDHEDILGNWVWGNGPAAPDPKPEPEPEPTPTEANPNIVEAGWVNVSDQFENLPEYLNVYKKDKTTDGDAAIAYIAVADAATAKFEVASDVAKNADGEFVAEHVYTPTEFYNNNEKPAVVINGGLFFYNEGLYYSQSAVYKDGELKSPNQTYYSLDWTNFWYPTLGFFFQDKDGNFRAQWSYYKWTGVDYLYDEPRKCDPDVYDTDSPDPSDVALNQDSYVKNGIGGIGVLVHDGVQVNSWKYEMLDVAGDSNQPRTAVGYAKGTNRLVFFVCEGRQVTEGVAGMTLDEVSNQMSAIGCTEALALDGGGSSCMLINGKETIKPCDDGNAQRAVMSACFMR